MRLDQALVERGLAQSRSQAQRLIKLGKVTVDKKTATKVHATVFPTAKLAIKGEKYVSRGGFKLASVVEKLGIDFGDKTVLDVGSSTGGFTDYSLKHGAKKVIAVDVGTEQLHPSLRGNDAIELNEKTDIREFVPNEKPDIVLIDLSFISLREVLPHIGNISRKDTEIVAMVKPQFEAGEKLKTKGVIKNDTMRRKVLKDFEAWAKKQFVILNKADSNVAGEKGNLERFYLLRKM